MANVIIQQFFSQMFQSHKIKIYLETLMHSECLLNRVHSNSLIVGHHFREVTYQYLLI